MDLSNKTPAELDELIRQATEAKADAKKQAVARVMDELKKLVEKEGLDISDLPISSTTKPTQNKGGKLKAKWHHPDDPKLTYTGRGPIPKWLKEFLAKGKTKDDLTEIKRDE